MPIIDSKSEAKFDALIRSNKADSLMSFIMASANVKTEDNRKEEVANRLKSAYELFRENVKKSTSGAGTYGNGSRPIIDQFESQYTMGYEMGIWKDSDYHLNSLAVKVSKYEITVSEYVGIVFLNLFSYFEENNKMRYHHFLYEILKKAEMTTGINSDISKDMIGETLPIKKYVEQANLIFNYLIATEFFIQIDKNTMRLSEKWKDKGSELLELCNLEYKDLTFDEACEKFKDKEFYADYVTKFIKQSNSRKIEKDNSVITSAEKKQEKLNINYITGIRNKYASNRILFGAPGTGKSYKLNDDKKSLLNGSNNYERVTFHPDYTYSNFVGTYKPVPTKDKCGNETITYKYVPGPFMRIYVEALKSAASDNPESFLLIIEEINRANVAAVFGDVFQLLDRNDDNISEYSIHASEDMKNYISEKLGCSLEECAEIKLPDNLFIWATMNSADQGVFPMDTAFKRRWDFTYMGINENDDAIKGKEVILGKGKNARRVEWNELRKEINNTLLNEPFKLNEDKLLGPYFLSKNIFDNSGEINREKFIETFKNKVIMYLYEDAVKQKSRILFKGASQKEGQVMPYSYICEKFDEKGIFIFSTSISDKFKDNEIEVADLKKEIITNMNQQLQNSAYELNYNGEE